MKKIILALFAMVPVFGQLTVDSLEGEYLLTGFDPYVEKPYTGTATISKQGDIYFVSWTGVTGKTQWTASGTGFISNGSLALVYKYSDGECGLDVYNIVGDSLEGRFISLNKVLIGKEKLEKKH